MVVKEPRRIPRKWGSNVRLVVELNLVQYQRFATAIGQMGLNRTRATAMAIDFWLNSIDKMPTTRGEDVLH